MSRKVAISINYLRSLLGWIVYLECWDEYSGFELDDEINVFAMDVVFQLFIFLSVR